MLKQQIKYEDFDGNPAETTLHFNISRTEMSDNLDMLPEVEGVQKMLMGDGDKVIERELTVPEIQRILNLVKRFAEISYGERDGEKFRKEDPVTGRKLWNEFKTTAQYDAFMTRLFDPPENAIAFVLNILPNALKGEAINDYLAKNPGDPEGVVAAIKQAQETGIVEPKPQVGPETVELPTAPPVVTPASDGSPVPPPAAPEAQTLTQEERDPEDYTRQERLEMSQEDFDRIYGTKEQNWSQTTLMAAFQRKNQQ